MRKVLFILFFVFCMLKSNEVTARQVGESYVISPAQKGLVKGTTDQYAELEGTAVYQTYYGTCPVCLNDVFVTWQQKSPVMLQRVFGLYIHESCHRMIVIWFIEKFKKESKEYKRYIKYKKFLEK